MQVVTLQACKHNGQKHRSWQQAVIQSTNPLWLRIPPATPVQNLDGSVWSSDYEVDAYFHPTDWYNVFVLKKSDGVEWYCNVAAPPTVDMEKRQVTFIDYELDVYVYADRSYKVLDRDEFEENALKMRYSEEVRAKAEAGLSALLRAIEEQNHPFA
ncbi:UPF0374 protein YgaC [Effusibacillus dendaii]|uniref:UPF0374 protein YgaC n=1 Tax=Effusibacillus dendaii TaxID=2743772 RepID=A0A7I8DEM5_9BACL|nr:UPF0374 protein YgaC [Effusibacillus dendaii]